MSSTPRFPYDAWTTPRATRVRVPQQTWLGDHEARPDPEHAGRVAWFDPARGIGVITPDRSDAGIDAGIDDEIEDEVFFSFTAIPGSGYRTVHPGQRVMFDRADNPNGPVATRVVAVG
jgi:cold shock CspA family protein